MRTHPWSPLRLSAFALGGGLLIATLVPIAAHAATWTYEVASTVAVGAIPGGIAINATTNTVYVANRGDDTVSVIDGITGSLISTIGVGNAPGAVAVNPSTNTVYVTHEGADTVSVIDGATGAVVSTLAVGAWPYAIAVNETTNTVYVANLSHSMSVIDGVTRAVDTIAVGPSNSQLTGIAVNEATNTVYASDYINGRLWQIDDDPVSRAKDQGVPSACPRVSQSGPLRSGSPCTRPRTPCTSPMWAVLRCRSSMERPAWWIPSSR